MILKIIKKENVFSGSDYKFIKFICRKLIRITSNEQTQFKFFYLFEVQIMDHQAYLKIQSGPSEHHAYKERQKTAARNRIFRESM